MAISIHRRHRLPTNETLHCSTSIRIRISSVKCRMSVGRVSKMQKIKCNNLNHNQVNAFGAAAKRIMIHSSAFCLVLSLSLRLIKTIFFIAHLMTQRTWPTDDADIDDAINSRIRRMKSRPCYCCSSCLLDVRCAWRSRCASHNAHRFLLNKLNSFSRWRRVYAFVYRCQHL